VKWQLSLTHGRALIASFIGSRVATLTVSTTRPSKSYLFEQTFSISVPNTDALRSNVNGIVASLCAVPDFVLELR
jgi:H+/Cl- antiporter ClcA